MHNILELFLNYRICNQNFLGIYYFCDVIYNINIAILITLIVTGVQFMQLHIM